MHTRKLINERLKKILEFLFLKPYISRNDRLSSLVRNKLGWSYIREEVCVKNTEKFIKWDGGSE